MAAAGSARGRRRAPKRRRRARGLIIVLTSAIGVVGTGVAIGWGSHMFAKHRTTQNSDASQAVGSNSTSPGGPASTSSATAKGATAPPSSSGAKPSTVTPSQGPASASAVPKQPLPHATGPGTVTTLDVPSADTDMKTRPVVVYRPAVPGGVVLPVVYLLHGVPGEPQSLMDAIKPALDQAFTTGGLAPFEVAAPTGGGNAHNDTEWADAADHADLVESYLFKNVIPAVEGANPRPASMRAIAGFSMGGYGAANLALRHPDQFGQFVSMAGYFHVDDPAGMFNGDSALQAANTPDSMVKQAAGKRVLLLEDADESDPLISGEAAEFAQRLHDCGCGVDLNWHIEPGGHDFDFVANAFPKVINFLDKGF